MSEQVWLRLFCWEDAHDLFWLQRDPAIARRVGLPFLQGAEQAKTWIDTSAREIGVTSLGIVHSKLGLIGAGRLHVHADLAMFSLWIGGDFQGRGFGALALAKLFEHAQTLGARRVFGAAVRDNEASRHLMRKCGMRPKPWALERHQQPIDVFVWGPEGESINRDKQFVEYVLHGGGSQARPIRAEATL